MYSIIAWGYNGDYFCVTVLPTMEDVEKFVGPKLWALREEEKNINPKEKSIEICLEKLGEDFWNRLFDTKNWDDVYYKEIKTKLPLMGQDYEFLTYTIKPFKFGDIVSNWSDD